MQHKNIPVIGAMIERLKKRSDHDIVTVATGSRGDITLVKGYQNLKDTLERLTVIDSGASLGRPLKVAKAAHAALLKQRPAFKNAFASGGSEAMRLVYVQAVAGLYHTVSMICASCLAVRPDPSSGLSAFAVDQAGVAELSKSIPVDRLDQFAQRAEKYGFAEAVTESAPVVEREAVLGEDFGASAAIAVGAVAAVGFLVYVARDLAEYFFHLRGSFAKWLDLQASFLTMNAAQLTPAQAGARAKQIEYARQFKALADRVRVEAADAEREAKQDIKRLDAASAPPASEATPDVVQSGGQFALV